MELKEYMNILKKHLLLIAFLTLLFTLISAVASYFIIKPVYKANISVIINKSSSDTSNKSSDYNDLMLYQNSVKTYSILATSRKVAEDVIDKLSLKIDADNLIAMIAASPNSGTEFMTLTVKDKDPKEAVAIANQLAKSLRDISITIKKEDLVHLVDDAQFPAKPDSPKPLLNIAIALFLGFMVSVGVSFLIEYLDSTIKTQEELEGLLELPVIGVIPFVENN